MKLEIQKLHPAGLRPITKEVGSIRIAGKTVAELIAECFPTNASAGTLTVRADFLPSPQLAAAVAAAKRNTIVRDPADGAIVMYLQFPGNSDEPEELRPDGESFRIRHPWDLLTLNEKRVGALTRNDIRGTIRNGVTLDGLIELGEGSVLLPGVYIEGNVVIGRNCKIGPNCYLRGNTSIGDRCHIGQAVEIKNSLIGEHVSVGHLSYAGDTVISDNVNFGAGTIISNLRHDGCNHRWLENGAFLDTGRRKFGAVIGENVHTGIHTSIYPGRSLGADTFTLPGEVVSHSK